MMGFSLLHWVRRSLLLCCFVCMADCKLNQGIQACVQEPSTGIQGLWHIQAGCSLCMQAAMAQLFKVYIENTKKKLTNVKADTCEGMLLKALVTSIKGRLEDSNGAVVTEDSTDPVLGEYRFFVDAAGRQLPQMRWHHHGQSLR